MSGWETNASWVMVTWGPSWTDWLTDRHIRKYYLPITPFAGGTNNILHLRDQRVLHQRRYEDSSAKHASEEIHPGFKTKERRNQKANAVAYIFLKNWGHQSLVGQLIPMFWTSSDKCPRFQSQDGSLTSMFYRLHAMDRKCDRRADEWALPARPSIS